MALLGFVAGGLFARHALASSVNFARRVHARRSTPTWDFTVSSRRWGYELLLAEFKALRDEIVSVKTQVERTYTYLFAVVGAIAASSLVSEDTLQSLGVRPWPFLVASLLVLWFPINHLLISADMVLAGTYIRDVVAPKLNNIASNAVQTADELGWDDQIKRGAELLDRRARRRNERKPGQFWKSKRVNAQARMTDTLKAPMSWEQFMPFMRMDYARRFWSFAALYGARILLLYVPSLLLICLYAHFADDAGNFVVQWWEPILWFVEFVFVGLSVVAQGQTAKLVRDGIRADLPAETKQADAVTPPSITRLLLDRLTRERSS